MFNESKVNMKRDAYYVFIITSTPIRKPNYCVIIIEETNGCIIHSLTTTRVQVCIACHSVACLLKLAY